MAVSRRAEAQRLFAWPSAVPTGAPADAAVALAVATVVVGGTLLAMRGQGEAGRLDPLGWLLIFAAPGSLVLRRRHPVAVAAFTLVACALYYPISEPDGPILLAFAVALYTAAAEGHLTAAVTLGIVAMLAVGYGETAGVGQGAARTDPRPLGGTAMFLLAGWLVAAIAMGGVKRNRLAYLREVEQRAVAAEHGKEEEARRRATEERLRIARELHDVLGHNISLINVQASAALHRLAKDPAQAEEALAAIKQTSKEALRELRTTLGMLRQVDEEAPTAPAPGLERLGELVDRARAAGLAVRTEIEGEPQAVSTEIDLAAYRIVQEALTNVARHAAATTAVVRVRYRNEEVCVEVDDDGVGGVPAPGNGILGMDERVRVLGGQFTAGGRPGGSGVTRRPAPAGGITRRPVPVRPRTAPPRGSAPKTPG